MLFRRCCSVALFALSTGSAALMGGCQPSAEEYAPVTGKQVETVAEDIHVHVAPHGGHLIEVGSHQFNVEVLFDAATKDLTLYVLDAHAENPLPVAKADLLFELEHGTDEEVIDLTPVPQSGDPEGKASKFTASGNEHLKEVADIEGLHAHVHLTVDGKEYEGELSHGDEAGHEHDHDHPATPATPPAP